VSLALPAGEVVDEALDELVPHLPEGDVVADDGNPLA
jgi:6-phosphogluconate dehydrogenase (decarboxylating)